MENFKGTTIVCVRRDGNIAIAGDGQVSLGPTIMKSTAKKVRTIRDGSVLCGFAGSTADALTLFDKFEAKMEEYRGNIKRASVELAMEWRKDKYLRKLEALLVCADKEATFIISGTGDVIEPEEGIAAIGSGGSFALSAARMLKRHTDKDATEIVRESLLAASEICVYTNSEITIEEIL